MAQYSEKQVIRVLSKRRVNVGNKVINLRGQFVGIDTWGKIDYLVNKKGYRVIKDY